MAILYFYIRKYNFSTSCYLVYMSNDTEFLQLLKFSFISSLNVSLQYLKAFKDNLENNKQDKYTI